MKVPETIKKAIRDCAKFNDEAKMNEKIVIEWLEKMKLTEETCFDINRAMEDNFIDCCEIGNNPDDFIEAIENLK